MMNPLRRRSRRELEARDAQRLEEEQSKPMPASGYLLMSLVSAVCTVFLVYAGFQAEAGEEVSRGTGRSGCIMGIALALGPWVTLAIGVVITGVFGFLCVLTYASTRYALPSTNAVDDGADGSNPGRHGGGPSE